MTETQRCPPSLICRKDKIAHQMSFVVPTNATKLDNLMMGTGGIVFYWILRPFENCDIEVKVISLK